MWCLLQNTEAIALIAKRQTDFALRQLDCKQHGEHRTARYPASASFVKQFNRHNICSKSHSLPDVLAPLCANPIFNCEQIKLANCSSAMLQLVNSMHRKPRAQSPSIGIIMQRTLPIYKLCEARCSYIQDQERTHNALKSSCTVRTFRKHFNKMYLKLSLPF